MRSFLKPLRHGARRALGVLAACLALGGGAAQAEELDANDALARAARQSPALAAALADVRSAELAARAEENGRVPVLNAGVTAQYGENLNVDPSGGGRSDSEQLAATAGVTYTTDIGTSLEAGLASSVTWRGLTGTAGDAFGPSYESSLFFTARQPLLRGGGRDAMLTSIEQARLSAKSASVDYDQTVSQTAHDVLGAYWDLWYATRAVKVERDALETAKKQLADAKAKEDSLGTGSHLDVLQFASSAASIQDSLSQAEADKRAKAIELGRLLGMTPAASLDLSARSDAPPPSSPVPSDLEERLEARSLDLKKAKNDVRAAELRVVSAEDADQPKLDAFTTVSMGVAWAGQGTSELPGGRPAFSVLGGLSLEVPLGESREAATAAKARSDLSAAKDRYQAKLDSVRASVATLENGVKASADQVRFSEETAEISRELAQAERDRFALGLNASSDVVKAEQSAREAELRALKAQIARVGAELDLSHQAGLLIERVGKTFKSPEASPAAGAEAGGGS